MSGASFSIKKGRDTPGPICSGGVTMKRWNGGQGFRGKVVHLVEEEYLFSWSIHRIQPKGPALQFMMMVMDEYGQLVVSLPWDEITQKEGVHAATVDIPRSGQYRVLIQAINLKWTLEIRPL
jgi:hypothetical protein